MRFPDESQADTALSIYQVEVSLELVKKAISELKAGFSPGPHGVPPRFFKMGGETILIVLTYIFSVSLAAG